MSSSAELATDPAIANANRSSKIYPWVCVVIAALAMVATMPGRTQGLGLITEPLKDEFRISRVEFGWINLWATLLGGLFCLPCGILVDRFGIRRMLVWVTLSLGATVLLMCALSVEPVVLPWFGAEFFILILLTRGLGQSALSVISLALIGRAAGRRGNAAMAVYSVLVTCFFMGAFGLAKLALEEWHAYWWELWAGIGVVLVVVVAPLSWAAAPGVESLNKLAAPGELQSGSTLREALRTRAFWIFAIATSLYGLITSGITLFNQSILEEKKFDRSTFLNITIVTPIVGLVGNMSAGWLARHFPLSRLMAVAMFILATALCVFPWVATKVEVYAYAMTLGFAGGMITMIFFAVWVRLYGARQLGRIQGAAQILTVVASAFGPLLFAIAREQGSYIPAFRILAGVAVMLALVALTLKDRR